MCLQQHPKIIWFKIYPKSPTMLIDYLSTNIKMVGTNICKISQNLTNIFLYIIYQGNIPWLHSLLNLIPSTAAVPQHPQLFFICQFWVGSSHWDAKSVGGVWVWFNFAINHYAYFFTNFTMRFIFWKVNLVIAWFSFWMLKSVAELCGRIIRSRGW